MVRARPWVVLLAAWLSFGCGSDSSGASPPSGGGGASSGGASGSGGSGANAGTGASGGMGATGGGAGAGGSTGGAAGAAQSGVWPGTSTRFYPGIYPHVRSESLSEFQSTYDAWFSGVEDDYREKVGATPVTYLGISVGVDLELFFSDYWRTSSSGPYDWKGSCARFSEAADPNAAPGGHPLYDFSWFDDLLSQSFVTGGGKVILRVMETYSSTAKLPAWMLAEGYSQPGQGWSFSQMQDSAVVYMWQDIMSAFAKKYAGDTRIASVVFDETYPALWTQVTLCGNLHGLEAAKAANAGLMEIGQAYLDVDPGMLWTIVNWHSAMTPVEQTWEQGYDLGAGAHTPGADDLPGVQGHWRQDIKFWQAEGSGAPCSVDADESPYMNFYLAQYAAIHFTGPVFVGTEANGWTSDSTSGHRNGADNPWNAASWPAWDPPGSLPNDGGDLYPSTAFWVWYTSGEPRASDPAARDSGLGQSGDDPCGVVPAAFYVPSVPNYTPTNRPAWTSDNLSIAKFRHAFDAFGPKGTKAMFQLPPGYLAEFQ